MLISTPRQRQLAAFIERLGLPPTAPVHWELLDLALTHISLSPTENNEQLEFLGDAVLRLFVAQWLWHLNRSDTVGQWSAVRSALVSDHHLAEIAFTLGLERFLEVAPSAAGDLDGATSRLADALEAVIGALYLSTQDFTLIEPWLSPHLATQAAQIRADPAYQNYKAALQQWTQGYYHCLPKYQVTEIHPSPTPQHRFRAEVWLHKDCLGIGLGPSRKVAEKQAAQIAYLKLKEGYVPQADDSP